MNGRRTARRLWLWAALGVWLAAASVSAQSVGDEAAGPPHRREEAAAKAEFFARLLRGLAVENPARDFYDVFYYRLDLGIDPESRWLTGTVTMRARPVVVSLSSAQLDLDDSLSVDAVSAGGAPAPFAHSGGILSVTLDRSYAGGEPFEIVVRYGGLPNTAARNFVFDTHGGRHLVWTLSEPYGARVWWPCKDTPADKADSVDVNLTVPAGMFAVSQGTFLGATSPGPDLVTYRWRERYPIATYLVSVAAYAYVAHTVTYTPLAGGSMPVTVWSYPEDATLARPVADVTVEILQRYASLFGEYPFVREKYGQAQFAFGGGMEHQTATSAGNWNPGLSVHETAHQWFGDAITCRDFSHIWLNEGFATYCEALWDEGHGGTSAYLENLWGNRYYGPGTIWVPSAETASFGRIFDLQLSYNKPSWVLHMLRGLLGDPAFFQILRAYAQDPHMSYGTATTEGFQSVAQAMSGRDLSNFFTNWIYRPYYPAYLYDFSSRPAGGGWQVHLEIEQLQTQALYDMPIQVRVVTAAGFEDRVVGDSLALQSFDLRVAAEPTAVQLDPDGWILHTAERAIHAPSFARGVLVVNGVDWDFFGAEAASAYADSVFAGRYPFEFWDCFYPPPGGYVPQLPAPIGHGTLPPEVLGQFSTVVWVGNTYAGDLEVWNEASIVSYLRQGGNLLLLSRRGQELLATHRSGYLGLRWAENPVATLGGATPALPGLVPMTTTDVQTQCSVFETGFDQPETQLLLTDATYFTVPRGIAAWRRPVAGGSVRSSGGHFAFVSGRPCRWAHAALRANVQTILSELFGERPPTPVLATLEATQEPAGIRLDWRLADPTAVHALRLRRSESGRLPRTLTTWSEGDRHGTWLDRGVRSGGRYRYELIGDLDRGPVLLASRDVVRDLGLPAARTRLLPVVPNPFNPSVELRYELARSGRVTLRIFDAQGRLVRALLDAERPSGHGTHVWDGRDDAGRDAPSGVYLIRLQADRVERTVKATLAR